MKKLFKPRRKWDECVCDHCGYAWRLGDKIGRWNMSICPDCRNEINTGYGEQPIWVEIIDYILKKLFKIIKRINKKLSDTLAENYFEKYYD